MRVLFIYYSQSGEVQRAAESFSHGFAAAGWQLTWQRLAAQPAYPHPWRSVWRFFDVMPDCLLGHGPQIAPTEFQLTEPYDLIVLAYPVWFLSPALPVQALFQTPQAAVLDGARVITICVCRSMWHSASQRMQALLGESGALHCDNIVVTHQGSFWLTLVSTPRALLFGLRNRLWGVFPKPGQSERDLQRLTSLGTIAAQRITEDSASTGPFLQGQPAVEVKRRHIVPEIVGQRCFFFWAKMIDRVGRGHPFLKRLGIAAFITCLLLLILVVMPVAQLVVWMLQPIVGARLKGYAKRLAEPTGFATDA